MLPDASLPLSIPRLLMGKGAGWQVKQELKITDQEVLLFV